MKACPLALGASRTLPPQCLPRRACRLSLPPSPALRQPPLPAGPLQNPSAPGSLAATAHPRAATGAASTAPSAIAQPLAAAASSLAATCSAPSPTSAASQARWHTIIADPPPTPTSDSTQGPVKLFIACVHRPRWTRLEVCARRHGAARCNSTYLVKLYSSDMKAFYLRKSHIPSVKVITAPNAAFAEQQARYWAFQQSISLLSLARAVALATRRAPLGFDAMPTNPHICSTPAELHKPYHACRMRMRIVAREGAAQQQRRQSARAE